MWGIIPAAGAGSRIQPLAFSKELLPVGARQTGDDERLRAVSEYLFECMILSGATKLCFVITPGKSDILEYYGAGAWGADIAYVLQPSPKGLCDAIFRAAALIPQTESVVIGLPDTVWLPTDALSALPDNALSFLLFPVERPEFFDAVVTDDDGTVREIAVKRKDAASNWNLGRDQNSGQRLSRVASLVAEAGTRRRICWHVSDCVDCERRTRDRRKGRQAVCGCRHAAWVSCGDTVAGDRSRLGRRTTVRRTMSMETARLEQEIAALGPWFHNMQVGGVWTAPDHFLGNYPAIKFAHFRDAIPHDLTGKTVLDIGCNGGFYSLEMKRRGAARVLGIDTDERYLKQARFAAEVEGADIEFRRMPVWDVASLREHFDLVVFMGVLYHLRHPLLALDLIHEHVAKDMLLFQSLQRGSRDVAEVREDYDFNEPAPFDEPGYPKMHFIEQRYSHDETNWWVPNRACTEAMLRSSGFAIESRPEDEVYLCRWKPVEVPPDGPRAVYPAGRQ